VLIGIAFYLLVMAAFRPAVLDPGAPQALVLRIRRSYRWGPPLYLLATIAAPFEPWVSMGINSALWIFWAVMTRELCSSPAAFE